MGGFKGYGFIFLVTCGVYALMTVAMLFRSAPVSLLPLPFAAYPDSHGCELGISSPCTSQSEDPSRPLVNLTLVWSLDYCGGCTGFAVEAYEFLLGLNSHMKVGLINGIRKSFQ
jgi:hypothetical protein